jgi:acyl-coenzyme A synthetase/AMP-(fatty) acid ligase/acetyltransferase-like isoleucine patch superfamily enzyme
LGGAMPFFPRNGRSSARFQKMRSKEGGGDSEMDNFSDAGASDASRTNSAFSDNGRRDGGTRAVVDAPMIGLLKRRAGLRTNKLGAWLAEELSADASVRTLLPDSEAVALSAPQERGITYGELKRWLGRVTMRPLMQKPDNLRVAVAVQNGLTCAMAMLLTISDGCACPVDPNAAPVELEKDITHVRASAVIVDVAQGPAHLAARVLGLPCAMIVADEDRGLYKLVPLESDGATSPTSTKADETGEPTTTGTKLDDTALVLGTSGTTGSKKLVPFTLRTLLVGAGCIIEGWELSYRDCGLNMMPLHHVGGLLRNLLAPLLSGGRMYCCPVFDPAAWWDHVETRGITWYYASPAMHRAILAEGESREKRPLNLRMACNAAGPLAPQLAHDLRQRFGCAVLPSYGMTECMPATTPPVDFSDPAPTTSGTPCGPEVGIVSDSGEFQPPEGVGHIVLRGPPVFSEYEGDPEATAKSFWVGDGWFDTGDMGYLDKAGWLYVTGRVKEVIKRGGETVSPAEVESAAIGHDDILECAAFAVPDSQLVENIGLAVVLSPGPRLGLPRLHAYMRGVLRPGSWPQLLLYVDKLPKTSTGKVQRLLLAKACQDITIRQEDRWRDRCFVLNSEGVAEKAGGPDIGQPATDLLMNTFGPTRTVMIGKYLVSYAVGSEQVSKLKLLFRQLDDVSKPDAVVQMAGPTLPRVLPEPRRSDFLAQRPYLAPKTREEIIVCDIWALVLQQDVRTISVDQDFFEIGGTSLLVGRVASELRKRFGRPIPTKLVFDHRYIGTLAAAIAVEIADQETGGSDQATSSVFAARSDSTGRDSEPLLLGTIAGSDHTSTNPMVLVLQLFPTVVFPVLTRMTTYVVFLLLLNYSCVYMGVADDVTKTPTVCWYFTLFFLRYVKAFVFPWFGIILKWVLCGRMRGGRYQIWSSIYVRWWLTSQALNYFGGGAFTWTPWLLTVYLRLLGADVDGSAKITTGITDNGLAAADLLKVGARSMVDTKFLKVATLDAGYLLLSEVRIEDDVSVGVDTVVHGGATIQSGATLGPWTSSYERDDSDNRFRRFNKLTFPQPSFFRRWFIGYPIFFGISLLSALPHLVIKQYVVCGPRWISADRHWFMNAVYSLTEPHRVLAWCFADAVQHCLEPLLYVSLVVMVKRNVVGTFVEGNYASSDRGRFKQWFMALILPLKTLKDFAQLVGPHYSGMTQFYRAMGAKVGKRIFWPGTPFNCVDYDLIKVGDDVVFGSRSTLQCSDNECSRPVIVKSGTMVADGCLLLPGTVLNKGAMLGSGSLADGSKYPEDSIWVGNNRGAAVQLLSRPNTSSESIRPFGKAVYEGRATHTIINWRVLMCIGIAMRSIFSILKPTHGWMALLVFRMVADAIGMEFFTLWQALPYLVLIYMACNLVLSCVLLFADICAKWMLVGLRKPGSYPWDTDPYCKRWKLYTQFRDAIHGETNLLRGMGGSWYITQYFRFLGADIGKDACLYPQGASPMMTEPELITVGERACVESASLVAHLNTFGTLELNPIRIGDLCTVRDKSRVSSGAEMLRGSVLLERSLAMPGDVLPEFAVWQGYPNRSQSWLPGSQADKMSTMSTISGPLDHEA